MRIEDAARRNRFLACNAAVEIACASDSANGSNVVAMEVEELAYQTSRAMKVVAGSFVSFRTKAKYAGQELAYIGREVHVQSGAPVDIAQQSEAPSKIVRNLGYVRRDIQIPGQLSDSVHLQRRST